MPDISLTDLVDFIFKVGTPKQTKVKQIKERGEYDPRKDFWRLLRNGIIEYHQDSNDNRSILNSIIKGLKDRRKANLYPVALKGYKKFLGRKQIVWFDPPKIRWHRGDLSIRVNPELGLEFNGQRHIVKLYFKSEDISKSKVQTILAIMQDSLESISLPGDKFCFLKVRDAKLLIAEDGKSDFMPLLIGEAAGFVEIWNSLD